MGYRTIVIFNNDRLDEIKRDPNFAEKLYAAILKQNCYRSPVGIETERACVGDVVHCSHADTKVSLRVIDFNAYEIEE